MAGLKWKSLLVYLVDLIKFSPTFEQHLIDIEAMLTRLSNANLRLKHTSNGC